MLNYTERYINFLAAFITVLIFVVIVLCDMYFFQNSIQYKEKILNCKHTENMYIKVGYHTHIDNAYTEVVQKVGDIYENRESKETEVAKIENTSKKESNEKQEINKLESINIYSTNKWRIKIPKLRLDAPITEGTTQEALRRTVGHFEETDKWNGNVALAAHNRGYKCNFFQEIKTLQKGDIIIYSTEQGERQYQVVVNTVIEETDWRYIQNTEDNRITLITCETNKKAYRRCIQALEIV